MDCQDKRTFCQFPATVPGTCRPDKRYAPSGNSAMPDGGSRLIRPTKAYAPALRRPDKRSAIGQPRSAGWRLSPYPAYKTSASAPVGPISAAPSGNTAMPDGGFRLIRPTKAYASVLRRPDKRYAPSGNVSATPVFFIFDMTAMGVVSPLKSANRSVNGKVWTPGMADKGEPRQGQNCREQF